MLTRKTAKLCVNHLEDRWVPALLDLTSAGAFGQVGDAVFAQFSGVVEVPTDTFLSIEAAGGTEQGYNTDNVAQFDEVVSHSIRVSDLPVVTLGGAEYVEFLLDVQEGNSKQSSNVSLDDVAVFVGPVGNLTSFSALPGGGVGLNGFPAQFHLDSVNGVDNGVLIDGKLSKKDPDMLFYLPKSLLTFEGESDPYVYLYSRFGIDASADQKAESWMHGIGGAVSPSTAATIDASGLVTPPPPPVVPPPPPPPADDTGTGDTGGDDGTVWL